MSMEITTQDNNVLTLGFLMNEGIIRVPEFQRNYVWDRTRASCLVDSIKRGLPVPEVFLYRKDRKLLIIDGQQRLLSLFFFLKGRFPRMEKRGVLRRIILKENNGKVPDDLCLSDGSVFEDFPGFSASLSMSIKMSVIRCQIIVSKMDNDELSDIFERLNNGVAFS